MSFYLSKIIDKFEPFENSSSGVAKGYYSGVNETIQEEEDEEIVGGLLSAEIANKLKAQHDKVNKFLQLGVVKPKKIKSICLESEPILEDLEEYNVHEMDPINHTFIIPRRDRNNSIDIRSHDTFSNHGMYFGNQLAPILEEKKDEDEN